MTTKIVPISDLRRRTAEIVTAIQDKGEVYYVTQHGRPIVVVLDYARYEALLDAVLPDAALSDKKRDQPDDNSLRYLASLAQDLGLEDLSEQHDRYLYGAGS